MAKKTSMDDIAKKLGISKNTVSLALRGMPGISGQTRKLILDTARESGYEYKKGMKLPGSRECDTRNICLILSRSLRNTIGFYSYIQFGIEAEAKKNNINTILYYFDENDENFETPLCIKEGMISGIITLGHISEKTLNAIIEYQLPLVVIDEYFDNMKLDYILTDNLSSGYIATEYLIQCGHRDIGYMGDIHWASSFYDRYLGYLRAMEVYGLTINPPHSLLNKNMQHLVDKDVQLVVQHLKTLPGLPTAFFCCNDPEAFALYKAFEVMGIKIPEDVSIIGFDDIDSARNVSPELTTLHIEKELMGKKAVQRLVEKMEDTASLPQKILLSTTLVERKSVKRV